MTNRPTDLFSKDCYGKTESRLNQQMRCKTKLDEGCPVIDESGTVCGETDSLSIFKEFRKVYEECLKKLEDSPNGSALLEKLSPFTKIVDDLWEQNTMLVEAVEELEQEATCQMTSLQNKLDKSCQKIFRYKNDIESLVEMIRRLKDENLFDTSGLTFYTLCPDCMFGNCSNRCSALERDTSMKGRGQRFYEKMSSIDESISSEPNCGVCCGGNLKVCSAESWVRPNKSGKPGPCFSKTDYRCSPSPLRPSQSRVCSGMSCDSSAEDDLSSSEDTNESQDCIKLLNVNFNVPNKNVLNKKSCCHCDCTREADSCSEFDE